MNEIKYITRTCKINRKLYEKYARSILTLKHIIKLRIRQVFDMHMRSVQEVSVLKQTFGTYMTWY